MRLIVNPSAKLNWPTPMYCIFALYATMAIALPAQTLTTLHSFDGTDGQNPVGGLVQAPNGDLYGTTSGGAFGNGNVFKMPPNRSLTSLYDFCSQPGCTDGKGPQPALVQDTNGDLYGTTQSGGASNAYCSGCGTVFRITSTGTFTTLYSFCTQPNCADGMFPIAGLVQATNGYLYGTTSAGGANGAGRIFRITPGGTLTTLHTFCAGSCLDGNGPQATLIQADSGDLYGTAGSGGVNGGGTVFRITPSGTLTTVYSFDGADGLHPLAGLVQAANGNFYGTTYTGGTQGLGTVFELTPSGTLTTLYNFCSLGGTLCTDGSFPVAGLVQGANGAFYGTTQSGGAGGSGTGDGGTAFAITPSGTLTTLHNFCSTSAGGVACSDGAYPVAGLVQDTNGKLYGTTLEGGVNSDGGIGDGTVFSISVGLGPFVETLPASGAVGSAVKILGTNLTGAIKVTFDGAAAAFTVVSSTEIATTVPAGAATGTVQVITSSGTLSSNARFRVP